MSNGTKVGVLVGLLLAATNSMAEDLKTEYLKVTGYASVLGHAQACNLVISEELACMETWIDQTFTGEELAVQAVFSNTVKYSGDQQKGGRSQITCNEARTAFRETKCGPNGPVMSRVPGVRPRQAVTPG